MCGSHLHIVCHKVQYLEDMVLYWKWKLKCYNYYEVQHKPLVWLEELLLILACIEL